MVKRTRRQRAAGKADTRSEGAKAKKALVEGKAPAPSTHSGFEDNGVRAKNAAVWQADNLKLLDAPSAAMDRAKKMGYDPKAESEFWESDEGKILKQEIRGKEPPKFNPNFGKKTYQTSTDTNNSYTNKSPFSAGRRGKKTAGRRRRSSRRNSLSAMLGKPLKMLMGKKTRKHRRGSRRH